VASEAQAANLGARLQALLKQHSGQRTEAGGVRGEEGKEGGRGAAAGCRLVGFC